MSLLLLNLEEVLALNYTILRQVCAVDTISNAVTTELCSERVRTETLRDFWVHWPAQLSE